MSATAARSKAERLAVAGAIAPVVRQNAEKLARRRVRLWNQQTGEDGAFVSGLEAQKGIQATAEIEFDVQPQVRPKEVICTKCGRLFRASVSKNGYVQKTCLGCRRPQETCANPSCSARPPRCAFLPSQLTQRGHEPWRCRACSGYMKVNGFERPAERVDRACQKACAGVGPTFEPCKKRPHASALKKSAIESRKGEPWRCRECARTRRHIILNDQLSLRQKRCAGWRETEGNCLAEPKNPAKEFSRSRMQRRGGEPWRCQSCALRMMLDLRPDVKRSNGDRLRRLRSAPGWAEVESKRNEMALVAIKRQTTEQGSKSAAKAGGTRRAAP